MPSYLLTRTSIHLNALAPYQPVSMKVVYCPIDTRLNFSQANKLIRDLRPKYLVIPEQYSSPPSLQPGRTDLIIDPQQSHLITHRGLDELVLPVKRSYITIDMDPSLAADMVPFEIRPGVAVVQLASTLRNVDNKYTMEPLGPDAIRGKKRKLQKPILYGNLNIAEFIQRLEQYGIKDAKVEDADGGNFIIDLQNEDSLIQILDGSIHIACNEEATRVKIRDATLQSLQKITAAKIAGNNTPGTSSL
ncbi:hypothetical protein EB796_000529 [Bugula neritina]|uniref:Integrator complex subunit 9-like C-terminal domain-containing protein n=1 Tax=Bugula neritina TaxID=10212 RepID=A0A7J7KSL7_BUGNE|nr:hypothetical protein EB796_000529 [Bugula neritina]